jgi:hypothetical protein
MHIIFRLKRLNTFFPPLRETPNVSPVKYFAEASELFTFAVFQFVVFGKTASSGCQKGERRRVLNRGNGEGRTNANKFKKKFQEQTSADNVMALLPIM